MSQHQFGHTHAPTHTRHLHTHTLSYFQYPFSDTQISIENRHMYTRKVTAETHRYRCTPAGWAHTQPHLNADTYTQSKTRRSVPTRTRVAIDTPDRHTHDTQHTTLTFKRNTFAVTHAHPRTLTPPCTSTGYSMGQCHSTMLSNGNGANIRHVDRQHGISFVHSSVRPRVRSLRLTSVRPLTVSIPWW